VFVITELSVMEQRYQAVLEVEAGILVVEVAHRFGVPAPGDPPLDDPLPQRRPGSAGRSVEAPEVLPVANVGRG
jgi:hypothetical protein